MVEQYKHGGHLNALDGGRYSANVVGFALTGKFGDPALAHAHLQAAEGKYWELLGLTVEQAIPLDHFVVVQDCNDIGTETIFHDLFGIEHFAVHLCDADEWRLDGKPLSVGIPILLPLSDLAKKWLALAALPENRELRNVRVNDLRTGIESNMEMQLCLRGDDLAIFVHCNPIGQRALDKRLWWLTRSLNLFMAERIEEISRRQAA